MKTIIITFVFAAILAFSNANAQNPYYAENRDYSFYDLSDNLDLEAMAYVFASSPNLKSFERKLNSSNLNLSNLDLNRDGYVDYLRVLELPKQGFSVIFIQAVLGRNVFQDVATIEVNYLRNGRVSIQVVGDEYLFGANYIVEPVFWKRPVIAGYFSHRNRSIWHSPYEWNRYPVYYSYRRPARVVAYQWNIYNRYSSKMVFAYPDKCYIDFHLYSGDRYHRHDYSIHHPEHSFKHRNDGYRNKKERVDKYYDSNHQHMNRGNYSNNNNRSNSNGNTHSSRDNYRNDAREKSLNRKPKYDVDRKSDRSSEKVIRNYSAPKQDDRRNIVNRREDAKSNTSYRSSSRDNQKNASNVHVQSSSRKPNTTGRKIETKRSSNELKVNRPKAVSDSKTEDRKEKYRR